MSIDDETIDRLVAAAQGGDPEAFGILFDHDCAPVYPFAAARVRRPWRRCRAYEARGVPFGGWLFRLARNVVIDHARTRRDHATLDVIAEKTADEARPDDLAVLRQEMDSVAHALRRPTPEQREAVELRFFAGLFAKEAAAAMGWPEGTIRGPQFRAIAGMRRELGIAADDLPEAAGRRDELGRADRRGRPAAALRQVAAPSSA